MKHELLAGRNCLVTGGSGGIGLAAATALARLGATVGIVARDSQRGLAAREQVAKAGGRPVDLFLADLASQADIRRLAGEVASRYHAVHTLVNCASAVYSERRLTPDGVERTFALNHLAYFLLTHLLIDRLAAAESARVVNVSALPIEGVTLDFDDLQLARGYSGVRAYTRAKLANVLFTYELARRLASTGVTANVLHPGVVRTNLGRDTTSGLLRLFVRIVRPFALSPERGADTIVYLASSPEVEGVTGKFFHRSKERHSSAASYDRAAAGRLWRASEELTGLRPNGDRSQAGQLGLGRDGTPTSATTLPSTNPFRAGGGHSLFGNVILKVITRFGLAFLACGCASTGASRQSLQGIRMPTVTANASGSANISRDAAFTAIVPIDLASIFTGYGPLPAVVGTTDQTGAWDGVGQTRTVHLSDGNRVSEELTGYDRPNGFRYTVSGFTGPLGWLTKRARGEWWFEEGTQPGTTAVRWSYTFEARSLAAYPALWIAGGVLWSRYMQQAMDRALEAATVNPI